MNEQRLGRGLDELLSESESPRDLNLSQLPLDEIAPNPEQPRNQFEEDALEELTQSIEQQGVVEPIVVRPDPGEDHRYMIVTGERRWRAARQAGMDRIPGIVRELEVEQAYLLSLVENVQRENLSPLEEARAYRRLIDDENYSQEEVARAIGKSRSAVANRLRLLSLPDPVLDALEEGVISAGHARALSTLEGARTKTALNRIIEDDLSVRETERMVRKQKEQTASESTPEAESSKQRERPNRFNRLEAELESNLGTEVDIESEDRKSGAIKIHFSSPEQFELLREQLEQLTLEISQRHQ